MAYKFKDIDVDGKVSTFIAEGYEGEIDNAFKQADVDAGDKVEVLYFVDTKTGEDIEVWRPDYLKYEA